jgi:2-keto-3-deoxy-L-rhamnonate aldolase RhmA
LNMKEASLSAVQTLLVVAALLSLSPCARVADARFISTNPVKEKLFDGGVVYGAFLTIPSYKAVENVAQDGRLDFVWLEAEHTEWGAAEAQEMVVACENEGLVAVIRTPQATDVEVTKKFVGTGAPGIIFPNIGASNGGYLGEAVGAVQAAQYAIASIKYPPVGIRRAGAERANGYLAYFDAYVSVANNLTMAVLMVETPEAVASIDEIAALPGLDVLHLGPYDLSLRMNVSMDSPELAAAIASVELAAAKAGVPLGSAAASLAEAEAMVERGYRFFTIPGDMQMIQAGVAEFFGG